MGKVIVVTSGKGGVGKTTSTAVIDGLPFAVTHPVGYRSPLCRHSNASLVGAENFAGKKFREARDCGRVFGDTGRFRATETALIAGASGGKATESQRLFRRRRETRFAQDCVVVDDHGQCTWRDERKWREKNSQVCRRAISEHWQCP